MSMEFNKLAAAILMAGIVAMFSGFIARELFHVEQPAEAAYAIAGTGGSQQPEQPEEEMLEPVLPLLAEADPAAGEKVFRACVACHSVEQGGPNKVGPNLWEIVGRDVASHEGFGYSDALASMAGQPWTYEDLNHFLADPRGFAPGTKMTYAGLKKVGDRADVIAYLRQQAAEPAPLPTQEEIDAVTQEASVEEAPEGDAAEGEAAAESESVTEDEAAAEGEGSAEETAEDEAAAGEAAEEEAEAEDAGEEGGTEDGASEDDASEAETGGEDSSEAATEDAGETQTATAGEADALLTAIADADPARGEKVSRACIACHSFEEGGPNKVGPNLYGVIGAPFAHLDDYNYSNTFKEAREAGRVWTYADLDAYLANPREFLPGNKMTYVGLKKDDDRHAVIAYLRQFHDDPPPLQ